MEYKLAINGGPKVRDILFPNQNTIGGKEIDAANRVLLSGLLTGYQANAGVAFHGGPEIKALEYEWSNYFQDPDNPETLNSIPTNSCTSGLFIACGAIGLKPGDEVIVTPYSMTCSATVPLAWGAIPVFADVHPDTFILDPEDIEKKITPKTKAIIVVDLFGRPYDIRIDEIAKKHNLFIIEDAAQAVGAKRFNKYAGTLGHIGVFSFNLGKHLTCGEGGMICTYDMDLAMKCRLLMNHAEAVVNDMHHTEDADSGFEIPKEWDRLFGFNLRMTEINAAIVRVQLSRIDELVSRRIDNAIQLREMLIEEIPGLSIIPHVCGYTNSYYVLPILFDENVWGVHRTLVVNAIKAELMPCAGREWEGVTIGNGYIKPIWKMPVFVSLHYPNAHVTLDGKLTSLTPVCDDLYRNKLIVLHRFFGPNADIESLCNILLAFKKVWRNREELK